MTSNLDSRVSFYLVLRLTPQQPPAAEETVLQSDPAPVITKQFIFHQARRPERRRKMLSHHHGTSQSDHLNLQSSLMKMLKPPQNRNAQQE